MTRAVYPGTFNPPTVAHVAVADAARIQAHLSVVELVVSHVPLGKEDQSIPSVNDRVAVLTGLAEGRPWLTARSTSARLVAEIAEGADAVVVGADKWAQIIDPRWYADAAACAAAVSALPLVLVAPRPPWPLPVEEPGRVQVLRLDPAHAEVSSTEVRAGRAEWIAPEAASSPLWRVRDPEGPPG